MPGPSKARGKACTKKRPQVEVPDLDPWEVTHIVKQEAVPVLAWGVPLPDLLEDEFELPWKEVK